MKCEHCGNAEVTFVYKSNINGRIDEKHLCGDCARKLGYARKLAVQPYSLFGDFFSPIHPAQLGEELLFPSLSRFHRQWESVFDDFFDQMPALGTPQAEEQPAQEPAVPAETQSRFSRMREKNALKVAMKQAARREDFEEAARLRDELKKLEEAQGESA